MASIAASPLPDGPGASASRRALNDAGAPLVNSLQTCSPQAGDPQVEQRQQSEPGNRDSGNGDPGNLDFEKVHPETVHPETVHSETVHSENVHPETRDLLLVGVHGWLLSGRLWAPLAAELAPLRQLWCPDLPGFGQRPRPRGLQASLASYGRWLADAVRERADGRPVVLISHSLGGSIALHSARHLGGQLRGLVQIAAGGGVYQPRPFALLRRVGATFVQWRPGWLAELPGTEAIRSPLRAEARAAQGLLACSTNRGAVRQLPLITSQLAVPSLWISGSRDRVMEPRYVRHLASFTPLHRLHLLEGAGHLPMQQCPQELAQVIEAWLQEDVPLSGGRASGVPASGGTAPNEDSTE